MIVRLKPFDPRKGHKLKSLIDGANDGKRYQEGALYTVSAEEAEYLSWFMQDATRIDPKTMVHGKARAFDIFPSMAAAKAVVDDEARGQLSPNTAQVDEKTKLGTRSTAMASSTVRVPPTLFE